MQKVTEYAMMELAQVYNTQGKQTMYQQLRDEYGIKQPGCFFRRMKAAAQLEYDEESDSFRIESEASGEVFMSMEELCAPVATKQQTAAREAEREDEMRNLIQELIGERLMELSRYVKLDTRSRTVMVDVTSLKNDGYNVVNH